AVHWADDAPSPRASGSVSAPSPASPASPASQSLASPGDGTPRTAALDPGPVPEELRPLTKKACDMVKKKGWAKIKWPDGYSALHMAAQFGEEAAVQWLLRAGAEPDLGKEDTKGKTPLDYANGRGHEHLVPLLTPKQPEEDDDLPPVANEQESQGPGSPVSAAWLTSPSSRSPAGPRSPAGQRSPASQSSPISGEVVDPGPIPEGLRKVTREACELVQRRGWSKIKWPGGYSALHMAAHFGE
ncbi:unnamed protein product, partial [Effrenium voratum]